MRNINRLHWLAMGLLLGALLFPVRTFAEPPFPWESTLENAQQAAAQSNRLVLIHFWAPWCGKCKKMESEVFNQPGLGAALLVNYVPVKINADQMPSTATKYGITGLPTDIIITPQGQVVDMMRGQIEATQYLARLNQIASARHQRNNELAQAPASIPARLADRPTAETPGAGNQSVAGNSPSDDRYADYYRRNPGNQPVLSGAMPTVDPSQPNPAPISPPYGQQQPATGPQLSGPGPVQSPATLGQQSRDLGPPAGLNMPPAISLQRRRQWRRSKQCQVRRSLRQPMPHSSCFLDSIRLCHRRWQMPVNKRRRLSVRVCPRPQAARLYVWTVSALSAWWKSSNGRRAIAAMARYTAAERIFSQVPSSSAPFLKILTDTRRSFLETI